MNPLKNDDSLIGFRDALTGRESSYDVRICADSPTAEQYQDGWNVVEDVKARRNANPSEPLEHHQIDLPEDTRRKIEIVAARYNLTPGEYVSAVMNLGVLQTFGKNGPK